MPDLRPLAPILTPSLTDAQVLELAQVLREWAGDDWIDATVDDLQEALFHQRLYLAALEREQAQRHATAGVIDLAAYRKGTA